MRPLGSRKWAMGKASVANGPEVGPRCAFPAAGRIDRSKSIAMLMCLLASGCSQTTAGPPPITADQQAQLAALAASPDSPEGLGEALAAVEANRQRQNCRARMNDTARQMKTMGAVSSAVGIAGRMAGSGGKAAAKAVAVGTARAVRGKLSQMQSC